MYQKLLNFLNKHQDKVFHFTVGMIIYLIISVFLPMWIAASCVLLTGLAKEIRDKISYGLFDWKDLLVTIAGGIFVWVCLYLKGS